MGNIIAIVSVLLGLVAAGCIAYVAWALTSEDVAPEEPDDNGPPNVT